MYDEAPILPGLEAPPPPAETPNSKPDFESILRTPASVGAILFHDGRWYLQSKPHVRVRLRRLFQSVASQGELLQLSHTKQTCEDLEWILQRYPHDLLPADLHRIQSQASTARAQRESVRELLLGKGIPNVPLAIPLRHYQETAVAVTKAARTLLLADDIGLGKSASAIGVLITERPAMVVCQTHVQKQWQLEIGRFAPLLSTHIVKTVAPYDIPDADVIICPYSKLHGWRDHLAGRLKLIVFDEAQELRHAGSQKYGAAAMLANASDLRMALTATPVYNYGSEIFNVLNALDEGALGLESEFHKEWCRPGPGGKWVVSDPKALGTYLLEQGMMLRRRRHEVGRELPPLTKVAHEVPYNPKIIDQLKGHAVALAQVILGGKFNERGQAAREFDLKLRQATGIAKAPAVAEFVSELCESGEKVLLGAWHRECYDIYRSIFRCRGIEHWEYTGHQSAKQKDDAKTAFCAHDHESQGGVLMMSLRSGAGVDGLQHHCTTVVMGELDYSPQVHAQFTGRVNRDGQTKPCTAVYLVSEAGSDPVISSLLGIKWAQGTGIVDPDEPVEGQGTDTNITGETPTQELNRVSAMAQDFLERYGK